MADATIIQKLSKLSGHMVEIGITHHEENTYRKTSGILVAVSDNIIHMKLCNGFGEWSDYYLNCHSCQLVTIVDYGKAKDES